MPAVEYRACGYGTSDGRATREASDWGGSELAAEAFERMLAANPERGVALQARGLGAASEIVVLRWADGVPA